MKPIIIEKDTVIYSEELHKGEIKVLNGAKLDIFVAGISGKLMDVIIDLDSEYSSANVNIITVANSDEKQINVRVNNNAKNTKGNITIKGIAKNKGICNINAVGHVSVDCSGSENYQESRVLLLDEASRGEASPLLLIDHNDVLGGHSASVSRVDEESIYYLQTRGVSKIDAELILTHAFFQPFLDECSEEGLEEKIWKM